MSADLRREAVGPVGLDRRVLPISSRLPSRSHSPFRVPHWRQRQHAAPRRFWQTAPVRSRFAEFFRLAAIQIASHEVPKSLSTLAGRVALLLGRGHPSEPCPAATLAAPIPRFPSRESFKRASSLRFFAVESRPVQSGVRRLGNASRTPKLKSRYRTRRLFSGGFRVGASRSSSAKGTIVRAIG